jgi:amino acid transporter
MGIISLFAISIGTASGAGRIMYALARDGGARGGLAKLSKHGQPAAALGVVVIIFICSLVGQQLAHSSASNATFYPLTIGTVLILVAYALATIGSTYYLFFKGKPLAPRWQMVIPVLGLVFVCYTILRNTFVAQVGHFTRLPPIEGAYLLIGLLLVFLVPGLAGRVRAGLAAGRDPLEAAPPPAAVR